MHIILSHGRGGSPNDAIIQHLATISEQLGYRTTAIDDAEIAHNPDARAEKLISFIHQLPTDEPIILMGFSMGGYTSVLAAEACQQVRGAFLIAPALYLPHYAQHRYPTNLINVEIVHGWADDIVIYEHSLRYAHELHAPLHLLPGSHMLLSQIPRIGELFADYLKRVAQKI